MSKFRHQQRLLKLKRVMSDQLSNFLAMWLNGTALLSNVLCRTILNIVAKRLNSPVQFCPFPVYPARHSHTCDPRVLLHLAFT